MIETTGLLLKMPLKQACYIIIVVLGSLTMLYYKTIDSFQQVQELGKLIAIRYNVDCFRK